MRALLGYTLGLALGLGTAQCWADDIIWRPAASSPSSRENAPATVDSTVAAPKAPSITINRPVPLNQGTGAEQEQNKPFQFRPSLSRPAPLFRAKTDDEPRPLPQGPTVEMEKKPAKKVVQERLRPEPIPVPPSPLPSSSIPMEEVISDCGDVPFAEPYTTYSAPGWHAKKMFRHGAVVGPVYDGDIMDDSCGCGIASDCGIGCGSCGDCVTDSCGICSGPGGSHCGGHCHGLWDDTCCYPRGKFWVSAEYLLWNLRDQRVPALVTRSNNPANPGILGQAGTEVIYGDDIFNNQVHSGGRINFGFWFPNHDRWGLEASVMALTQRTTTFTASSDGSPIIARPFFNSSLNQEDSVLVAGPLAPAGFVTGTIGVDYMSRIWGVEANLRKKLCCGPCSHLDLLLGFRHIQLDETISITDNETGNGTNILVFDQFGTRNQFNGGQIGLDGEWHFLNRFFLGGQIKVAVGNVRQLANINGTTTITTPGIAPVAYNSGVFAAPTNIGQYERNQFAVMPEFNLKLGLDITSQLRVFVGWNYLYLSNVIRPGDSIDRTINPTQLPPGNITTLTGPARPSFVFRNSSFSAQGLNVGLEYRY